jgi:hypothetical protein
LKPLSPFGRKLAASRKVDEDSYVQGELIQPNHSTHHRGQVVLMLRQLGKTPPGTGFRQFPDRQPSRLGLT